MKGPHTDACPPAFKPGDYSPPGATGTSTPSPYKQGAIDPEITIIPGLLVKCGELFGLSLKWAIKACAGLNRRQCGSNASSNDCFSTGVLDPDNSPISVDHSQSHCFYAAPYRAFVWELEDFLGAFFPAPPDYLESEIHLQIPCLCHIVFKAHPQHKDHQHSRL